MIKISGAEKLATDIVVQESPKSKVKYVRLSLLTKTSKKDDKGKNIYGFVNVLTADPKDIEYLKTNAKKGCIIEFEGQFEPTKFTNKAGVVCDGYFIKPNKLSVENAPRVDEPELPLEG